MPEASKITVSDHLNAITRKIEHDSGYPYPENSNVPAEKAFAYGLAIGTMLALIKEWEKRRNV